LAALYMKKLKEVNGFQVFQDNGGCLIIKLPTQTGWRQGIIPDQEGDINSISLPYRDRARPKWYVNVNNKKIALQ